MANETTDIELICKIYKQFIQLNTRKMNRSVKEWTKSPNRHLSKETVQLVNKHMKMCSTSFFVREIEIKTTMSYHLTSVKMASIKKSTSNVCRKGCEEKRNYFTLLIGMQTGTATLKQIADL